MSDIQEELNLKNYSTFDEVDPFNNNRVTGWMNRTPSNRYGALLIETVNDKPCTQFILATPKMHYPMERDGSWSLRSAEHIEVYEKLDGTNIFQYRYKDAEDNEYITYKTRQTPFVREEVYGFITLLRETMDMYPSLHEMPFKNDNEGISYELYGRKNSILVRYDIPIDIKVLFARKVGGIISPRYIDCLDIGHARHISDVDDLIDVSKLTSCYEGIKTFLNDNLKMNNELDENGEIKEMWATGMEGAMFYVTKGDGYVQYKCKPDAIFDIHTKASDRIPTHSIYITVKNAFEDMDEVTVDYVKDLLMEEFDEEKVQKATGTIMRIIKELNFYMKLKKIFVSEYLSMAKEDSDFNILTNKGKVMRHIAGMMKEHDVDKRMASKIYGILLDNTKGA